MVLLQLQFTGEEDGLYHPADEMLSGTSLAKMTRQMAVRDRKPTG